MSLRRTRLLLLALGCCMAMLVPATASANEAYVTSSTQLGCTGGGTWGSGSTDENGITYVECGNYILRYDNDGHPVNDVSSFTQNRIDLGTSVYDVATAPDGSVLYAWLPTTQEVARFNLQNNGSYVRDAAWHLDQFPLEGRMWSVRAPYIAVDAWGDLYFSNSLWNYDGDPNNQPNVIVKYSADGTFRTSFGEWGHGDGQFDVNRGIAVSRDGRSVYVSDTSNGRIQRFDYHAGTYRFAAKFGTVDTMCGPGGGMSAPYDVAIDPWGYVYVMNTSCDNVQKYSPSGAFLLTVGSVRPGDPNVLTTTSHGLSVDLHGNVYVGLWNRRYSRAASNPEPGPIPALQSLPHPDLAAPLLTNVILPATTTTRDVTVAVVATDDTTVTEYHVANEDGNWGPWLPFGTGTVHHTLTAGYMLKGITVEVRDAAGNVSNSLYRTTSYHGSTVITDTTAPSITRLKARRIGCRSRVRLRLSVADDSGVTQMRIANEDGTFSSWKPYRSTRRWKLLSARTNHVVSVQVRDAAGNESAVRRVTVRRCRG